MRIEDDELEESLDNIFDVVTVQCDQATDLAGRPDGKHYSDFDLFLMRNQLKQLIRQECRRAVEKTTTPKDWPEFDYATVEIIRSASGRPLLSFKVNGQEVDVVRVDLGLMVQLRSVVNQFIEEESQRIMMESMTDNQEANEI